jgi:hypothetical protein
MGIGHASAGLGHGALLHPTLMRYALYIYKVLRRRIHPIDNAGDL